MATQDPVTLSPDDWVDLGATPCFLQVLTLATVVYRIAPAKPAADVGTGHVLSTSGSMEVDIGSYAGQNLFARLRPDASGSASVIVTR